MSAPTLRYLSLGAGRQSTALYLLACEGRFGDERPAVAIFADTQDEPSDVYRHLERLERDFGHVIPIRRVTAGHLSADLLAGRGSSPPFFAKLPTGGRGPLMRNCTRDYKVRPIEREVRRLLGVERGRRLPAGVWAESWQGISRDEATRMKDNPTRWIRNRYPLALELAWTADDCDRYNTARGYRAPKSACVFCPYTSNARWRQLRAGSPADWQTAVAFDAAIRTRVRSTKLPVFVHESCIPLDAVDLSTAEERGQVNLFENACEGLCGV